MQRVPLVDYLVLDGEPHLVAHECTACGARYFDRRNACASCFGTDFRKADVPTEAGVSLQTVSRVINKEPNVRAETRDWRRTRRPTVSPTRSPSPSTQKGSASR